MTTPESAVPSQHPPGTRTCATCDGKGVIFQCVVCCADEPHTGTCGSNDPRALCNFVATTVPSPTLTASAERSVDYMMEAISCFASEWSLVGGRFDNGDMLEQAQGTKQRIRRMLEADAEKLAAHDTASAPQPAVPEVAEPMPEPPSLKARPLLYSESVNDRQVLRDDLWIVTTHVVNRAAASELFAPAAKPLAASAAPYSCETGRIDEALANFLAEHTTLNQDGIDTHAMSMTLALNYAAIHPTPEPDIAEWREQSYLAVAPRQEAQPAVQAVTESPKQRLALWNASCGTANAHWYGSDIHEAGKAWRELLTRGEQTCLTKFGCGVMATESEMEWKFGDATGAFDRQDMFDRWQEIMVAVCGQDAAPSQQPAASPTGETK